MMEIKKSRASRGKTTVFEYQGKRVDNNKLARLAKGQVSKYPGWAQKKDALNLKIAPRM